MSGRDQEIHAEQQIANRRNLDPVSLVKSLLVKRRGASGIKSIGGTFRRFDDNRDGTLTKEEFKTGMQDTGISMYPEELQKLFDIFDPDDSGKIVYDEFLSALRGPMNENRQKLVNLAFAKMDTTGNGTIDVEDLRCTYDVKHHPKFKSGEWTKDQVLREFLNQFDPNDDGSITNAEFMEYYQGVSDSIDEDAYFDLMMRSAWKL